MGRVGELGSGLRSQRKRKGREARRGGRKAINMIRCFLVINNFGKPRLMKFYERLTNEERQKAIEYSYKLVSKRMDDLCHFAALYFIVICDKAESELGILDLIQVYVETLDK